MFSNIVARLSVSKERGKEVMRIVRRIFSTGNSRASKTGLESLHSCVYLCTSGVKRIRHF